jgi:hypothetical protein
VVRRRANRRRGREGRRRRARDSAGCVARVGFTGIVFAADGIPWNIP